MIGMDVLIVGSIAYDSVSSPEGRIEDGLGGSATYAGLSSIFHAKRAGVESVALVGVVGEDFVESDMKLLGDSGLDISGIEVAAGKTFRWTGSYHGDMAEAQTHETHLNVFEAFQPKVPASMTSPKITFCANLHPALQASVLSQAPPQRLSMLDSMNLWINIAHDPLIEVMSSVDLVIINDGEVRMLADDANLVRAARKVKQMTDVHTLVVKRGEHGVIAFCGEEVVSLPAYPTELVVDPTGCGDTFAGALATRLSLGDGELTKSELRDALIHATVTASVTLEKFGVEAISALDNDAFMARLNDYLQVIS